MLIQPEHPDSTTFPAECTGCDHTVARKVRLYPTMEQKNIFARWFGISRYVYNKTVEWLNGPKESRPTHWMAAAKLILADLPEWCGQVPYQVKKIAVEDAYKAFANGPQPNPQIRSLLLGFPSLGCLDSNAML